MVISTGQERILVIGDPNCFDLEAVLPYIEEWHWRIDDESLDHVTVQRVLEYLSGPQRIHFCNELHRVIKPGGKVTLRLPYWSSPNAVADPYLVWPPITELSLQYLLDEDFRKRNQLKYTEIQANFSMTWGYSYAPKWHVRSDPAREEAAEHWLGVVTEIVVALAKR